MQTQNTSKEENCKICKYNEKDEAGAKEICTVFRQSLDYTLPWRTQESGNVA